MSKTDTILNFFYSQLESWPLAKKNYEDISNVRTKELILTAGVSITVQHNPARIVSTKANVSKEALAKRPCFLCEKNRPAEQYVHEKLKTDGKEYEVLINPFPILPVHFTIPSIVHERQQIDEHFAKMLGFVDDYPELTIFYNGPRSGASAPDHMHFQAGETKNIPFFQQWATLKNSLSSLSEGVFAVDAWPSAAVTFSSASKEECIKLFKEVYSALPIPLNEWEPMMNVFVRKYEEKYQIVCFLRSQHRPACYSDSFENHRLISPGALDIAGLVIAPRPDDFLNITAQEVEDIMQEVGNKGLLHVLKQKLKERCINVGLVESESEISFSLNGRYEEISILDEKVYVPLEKDATFTLDRVTIGVNFHWQQERKLTYSGILRLGKMPNGKNVAINILPIEDYLKSVISSEMSAMSNVELLKAHAILSRSWLIANIEGVHNEKCSDDEGLVWYDRSAHTLYDVCADDHCQRYQGVTMQVSSLVNDVIEQTRGKVLMYDDKVCDARFSKSCGGVSEVYEYCWDNTAHPYLESVVCQYCDTQKQMTKDDERRVLSQVLNDYDLETRDFHDWEVSLEDKELQSLLNEKLGIDFGEIQEITPLERGKSGRIWKLLIKGEKQSKIIGKELEIRRAFSKSHLYSSWFTVSRNPNSWTLSGKGWGHGVGLCQIGAAVMAEKGYKYDEILHHYFPKAEIK